MSEPLQIVAIDGPSGVGKSTVSKKVARATGYVYLDTGAMYRGVAYYLLQQGISSEDQELIGKALQDLTLELLPAGIERQDVGVRVNGSDISGEIRSPEISMAASRFSALAVVRQQLTAMQREIGARGRVVAEGRDVGTVVFPGAAYKFFLDASPEERSRRRFLQLQEKGQVVDYQKILRQTLERDKNDSEREIAPLKKAVDALYLDTTALSADQVCERIIGTIEADVPD
jgi:cytidylate kinase